MLPLPSGFSLSLLIGSVGRAVLAVAVLERWPREVAEKSVNFYVSTVRGDENKLAALER